jgi:hypothetical protein
MAYSVKYSAEENIFANESCLSPNENISVSAKRETREIYSACVAEMLFRNAGCVISEEARKRTIG